MNKTILSLALAASMAGAALAGTFRVTYTTPRGQIHRVTVQAESTAEARRTVQDIFPGAYVPALIESNEAPHVGVA